MTPNPILFACLLAVAILIFGVSLWRRFSLVALGKPENRLDQIGLRIWDMLLYAFGQKRVVQKPFGLNHFVIFWSFVILAIGLLALYVEFNHPGAIVPGVTFPARSRGWSIASLRLKSTVGLLSLPTVTELILILQPGRIQAIWSIER